MRVLKYLLVCLVFVGCCRDNNLDVSKGKQVNISFDDGVSLESLHANLDLFEIYDVKVTYYVSNIGLVLTLEDKLLDLVNEGHEIGVHGYNHFASAGYIEEHGIDTWLSEEVLRPKQVLDSLGIQVSTFSYPSGSRTQETDDLLKDYFSRVRGFRNSYDEITPSNDAFLIEAYSIDSHNFDLAEISNSFYNLNDGETLFLATHMIRESDSDEGPWYILRRDLEAILKIGESLDINFVTVAGS
tara:strand:- start:517 stop:1242 length:726 start_codon:yes stop_codon:yes gene_type:complete